MYMYACIHVHCTSLPPPQLSDGLGADNVRALKNLCYDVIPKPKLETIDSGLDVFNALIENSEWCLYSEESEWCVYSEESEWCVYRVSPMPGVTLFCFVHEYIHVHCTCIYMCFALFVCLTLLLSFFLLISH